MNTSMDQAWWEEYPRAEKFMNQFSGDNLIDALQTELGLPSGVAYAFLDKFQQGDSSLEGISYQEKRMKEGRRANALKMLSQMHAYLIRYNDLDKTEEHFKQRIEELGGTDLYAIVDAVLDVVETAKKVDKARMLRRVYKKYFPRTQADEMETDQEIIRDLDNAEGPQWPEEISMRTAAPDEEGGEGDYFANDDFDMDEPDSDEDDWQAQINAEMANDNPDEIASYDAWDKEHGLDSDDLFKEAIQWDSIPPKTQRRIAKLEKALQDAHDFGSYSTEERKAMRAEIAKLTAPYDTKKRESVEAFVNGEDDFSRAYDDADQFINDEGWPREQVEVYLMDTYKSLNPKDIDEIINSIPRVNRVSSTDSVSEFEHPVEEF